MKSIDEILVDKLIGLVEYAIAKVIKPDITIDTVTDLTEEMISSLKRENGIEGIILDVDDTLRKNMRMIPDHNKEWLSKLNGQIKVIILTNGIDPKIEEYVNSKGIDYIGFAHKPLKKNFIKACEKMGLEPDQVLVVGDSLIDDVFGGKRNDMRTVLVKNVNDER